MVRSDASGKLSNNSSMLPDEERSSVEGEGLFLENSSNRIFISLSKAISPGVTDVDTCYN